MLSDVVEYCNVWLSTVIKGLKTNVFILANISVKQTDDITRHLIFRLAPLPPAFGQLPPYEEKELATYEEKAEMANCSGSANSTSPPLSPSQVEICHEAGHLIVVMVFTLALRPDVY